MVVLRAIGRLLVSVGGVLKQAGGAMNGGRGADPHATTLYERPRDDFRP
ncbi:hypothetical protein [Humibacter ginsenosidimutans]|nr:hypothetical protein [Humibacter ginsenosidimutans]